MKEPELVTASQAELDEILHKAKPALSEQQYRLLEGVLGTFVFVMLKMQNAKTSIKRLQQMLFGARTELKRNVLEDPGPDAAGDAPVNAAAAGEACGDHGGAPPAQAKPGHGRNGAQAYSGAPIVECEHAQLQPGDACPQCETGRVYESPPRTLVKVIGQAPLGATVYKLQRLRCRLCDAIFTAALPAGVASCPSTTPAAPA